MEPKGGSTPHVQHREDESFYVLEGRFEFVIEGVRMVLWGIVIVGSIILVSGLTAPAVLLIISASLSAIVMVFYNVLLIVINRRFLPDAIKLGGWRLVAMIGSLIFYGFFAGWFVFAQITGA